VIQIARNGTHLLLWEVAKHDLVKQSGRSAQHDSGF